MFVVDSVVGVEVAAFVEVVSKVAGKLVEGAVLDALEVMVPAEASKVLVVSPSDVVMRVHDVVGLPLMNNEAVVEVQSV